MANNRTCYCCGKTYSYCPTCGADATKPSWYAMWDNEDCKKLDEILVEHTMNKITLEEAKAKILEASLDSVEILNEDVRKHRNEILGIIEKKIEEPVNEVKVDSVEEIDITTPTVTETVVSKFKKKK